MALVGRIRRATEPDEIALRDEETALSWMELDELLNRATNALLAYDLGPDRRVAVYAENSVNTVIAYLAEILAGCSGVPINYHLRAEECAYILRDSGTALIFAGAENAERAAEAAAAAGGIPVIAWGAEARDGIVAWEEFLGSGSAGEPPDDLRPRPYLHYTSGTTGFPKGTETPPGLYPGGEAATVREHIDALEQMPLGFSGPQLTAAPLYHSGQLACVKRSVAAGRALVLMHRFDPERVLEAIERFRVGRMLMVPTHFSRLLALPEELRSRYDVSSMTSLSHVGAPCPIDVKYRMIDWFGPVITEAYGATEQGMVSAISSEEWLAHPGSVGRVRDGLELHVVGEDGEDLGAGEIGRLYFRDLSGFDVRFHNDEEKTESVHLRPGLFTIGEVGYVDEAGYLYLTDRFSDQVISGGVNLFPAEAELVMSTLPGVSDVACIGIPDDDLGELLHALVVPADPEDPPSPDELLTQTRQRLTRQKCPRSIELVADLGRNPLGKLNKIDLRDRYLRRELRPLHDAPTAGERT